MGLNGLAYLCCLSPMLVTTCVCVALYAEAPNHTFGAKDHCSHTSIRQDVAATRHMKMMKSIAEKMQTFAVCMIICVCVTMCACISKKRNGHVHTYVCTCVHACNTLVTSRDITSHHITPHIITSRCITLHYVCVCAFLGWGSCTALIPNSHQCTDFRDI